MKRSLSLRKDAVTDLTTDELADVAGAAYTLLGMCNEQTRNIGCGIPTCNYMCTNTSTAFKG